MPGTSTKNDRKPWTDEEVTVPRELANANTPTRVIGLKLGRSEDAIRSKAKAAGISLGRPNRSPYGDLG